MKTSLRNFRSAKYLSSIIRPQLYIQKCRFSDSKLEFSNLDNDVLSSLSENELFQSVTPDASARRRHQSIEKAAWRRHVREPRRVNVSHQFSDILNARSVAEVLKQLEYYKSLPPPKPKVSKRANSKKSIMDILDSIAADDDDADNNNADKSEANDDEEQDYDFGDSDEVNINLQLVNAYVHAIEVCGHLKEFDAGFELYEEAKQNRSLINQRLYGNAMWLTMEKELSVDSLNKCYVMLDEMKTKYNLAPTAYIYAILIQNQTALRHFHRSGNLIKEMRANDYAKYLRSKHLRKAITNHYAKSKQIEEGIRFMDELSKEFGDGALDDTMYSSILTGIALVIKDGDESFIKVAEKLFEQSFKVLGRPPSEPVFSTLLSCYANIPDAESCIDMVKNMVANPDWPQPTGFTFSNCLKSLTLHYVRPMTYEQGWKLADEILHIMNTADVAEDRNDQKSAIYGLLFTLCGGRFCNQSDLDKLYSYYDEMKSRGYRLSLPTANSLLLSGIDHYGFEIEKNPQNKEAIKDDLKKFIDWALLQFKENKLSLNARQNERLQYKLSRIL